MKQSLKYGLFIVLLCLLHSIVMKAGGVGMLYSDEGLEQSACSVSQAHPTAYSAFDQFHLYCSTMPGEIGHTDVSHVPTIKSCYRLPARLRDHKSSSRAVNYHSPQLSFYSSSDPVSYYVFGLRKIII